MRNSLKKWGAVSFLLASIGACEKQGEEPKVADKLNDISEAIVEPGSVSSLEARAEALGFLKYLPASTEAFFSIKNVGQVIDKVKNSQVGGLLEAGLADEGIEIDELEANEMSKVVLDLISSEVLIAFGETTGQQGRVLAEALAESNYVSTRLMMNEMAGLLGEQGSDSDELIKQRMGNYIKLLQRAEMPPLTLAFACGEESATQSKDMLLSQLEMVFEVSEGVVEPIEFERVGTKFEGGIVKGEKLVVQLEEMSEGFDYFTAQDKEAILKRVAELDLVVAIGVVDGHLALLTGSTVEACQLVDSVDQSIAWSNRLNFCDPYLSNEIYCVMHASKRLQEDLRSGLVGSKSYIDAIDQGLSGIAAYGDLRELKVLLESIIDQERALNDGISYSDFGAILFADSGLRLEMVGGPNLASLNSTDLLEFSPFSAKDDVFLYANWKADPAYGKKQKELYTTMVEAMWLFAVKTAELDVAIPEIAEFKGMLGAFNTEFKPELLGLVTAVSDEFLDGLDDEAAFVVDLGGSFPSGIPGVPEVLVENGKLPRFTYLSKVKDRSKLTESWNKIDTNSKSLMRKMELPMTMLNFISSERDGLVTYIYPFPMQSDDFMAGLSVSDELFAFGSSKLQLYELRDLAKQQPSSNAKRGLVVEFNFDCLQQFAKEWSGLARRNVGELAESEAEQEDMISDLDEADRFIESLGKLERMDLHVREEAGLPRASFHLKMR